MAERPSVMMAATVTKFGTLGYDYLMFDAFDLGPVDLVLGQDPRLLEGGAAPFFPSGQCHHGVHVGASLGGHVDAVGVEAGDYRRVHRVSSAEGAEQERPAL